MPASLRLDDDRLFPLDPQTREYARALDATTAELPIISPHGHVPPAWLLPGFSFTNPTELLITPDHYVTRLMHANGVDLSALGVGRGTLDESEARAAFRIFCQHWPLYAGTAMRYWMVDQLVGIFGVRKRPSAETADQIYDQVAAWIDLPSSQPRALLDTFNIAVIATTDDPCDDLAIHDELASDADFAARHRVAPTFRPDRYLEPARADWNELVDRLGEVAGCDVDTLAGFTEAMQTRRAYFKAHGAFSTDHSHRDLITLTLDDAEAESLYADARAGRIAPADADQLRRHLFTDQLRMACDDGLVATVHPGVARSHDAQSLADYGTDVGADIPVAIEVTNALQHALNRFGNNPNLNLVLFTLDETVYSREIAALAGWYRSLYIGVPWWFIDAPESIMRFKRAVTEMAGFSRLSGMIDDTRAFCSIPARHDMARRLDAAHLAELIAYGRLDIDEAHDIATHLAIGAPRAVFKL